MEKRERNNFVVVERGVEVQPNDVNRFLRRAEASLHRLTTSFDWPDHTDAIPVEILADPGETSGSAEGIAVSLRCVLREDRHPIFEHELVHLLAARAWGYGPAFLREGLAYHLTRSGAVWKGATADKSEPVAWPTTLRGYRSWRNQLVTFAADDGQLPTLANLLLTPYFWALSRFPNTHLDMCVAVTAAASFTHFLLATYPKCKFLHLYRWIAPTVDARSLEWDSHATEALGKEFGIDVGSLNESWLLFASASRGKQCADAQAVYQRLRSKCGETSRPAPGKNCWICGHWWGATEVICPSCGANR